MLSALFSALLLLALLQPAAAREERRITANGTEFAYVEAGRGDALFLVHGGLQDYRMWEPLLASLPDGPELLRDQGVRLGPARQAFLAGDDARAVPLFVDGVRGAGSFQRMSEAERAMALANAPSHRADQISTRPRAPFACDTARSIRAPVLLTGGAESPAFFRRILDALEGCLESARRATVAGASHNVPGDEPRAFAAAVRDFVGSH
ncbi:MAG: hypothetical protein K2X11_13410 [Acetobacteraceae bacterium]|nr:hypothetical protein [Acetobacteraceae bacterium]